MASGLVSNTSTDTVNGSQLYTMTRPLRFAGDNSTIRTTSGSDVNVLHRGSDQAMSLLGGADSNNLSDKNIGVVADAANNKMTVKLNITLLLAKRIPIAQMDLFLSLQRRVVRFGFTMVQLCCEIPAIQMLFISEPYGRSNRLGWFIKARLYVIQGSTKKSAGSGLPDSGMIYGGDAESAGLDPATNKSIPGKEIKKGVESAGQCHRRHYGIRQNSRRGQSGRRV